MSPASPLDPDKTRCSADGTSFERRVEDARRILQHRADASIPGSIIDELDALLAAGLEDYRALAHRMRMLEELLSTTRDAAVFVDRDARICYANQAVTEVFGYGPGELVGLEVGVLVPNIERGNDPRGKVRRVAASRKDGTSFPVEVSLGEAAVGLAHPHAAFIRDLSDDARLEREVLDKERLATNCATASVLAHEMANPLHNISLHLQLLRHTVADLGLAEQLEGRLQGVSDEIVRLGALLHEFRSTHAQRPRTDHFVDLRALLRSVLDFEARAPEAPVVEFVTDFEADLPLVEGDSDKLRQVFVNLVKNALEAMPSGGTLMVSATSGKGTVTVAIEDTGIGLPDDVDVFAMFATTKPRGSGLGLPIVRKIVSDHGGTITYCSKQRVGTTFTVTLPARWDAQAPSSRGGRRSRRGQRA